MMKINFLCGIMAIKNARLKKQKYKKGSYLLVGIDQGGGIDVCQKTRKKKQKNCGHKHVPFVFDDQIQKDFFLKGP